MSSPAAPSPTSATPFADLPDAIKELLRDEANLTTARQVLEDARRDAQVREDELRANQPKIGFLVSKKQRDDFAAASTAIQNQIRLIDGMLARAATARERLQGPLRTMLLQHMQQADPLYRQGLRATHFHEHWRRAHTVIADRLLGFLRDLKATRKALERDIGKNSATTSDETTWCITNLHGSSVGLDHEIETLNHAATEHAACVQGTHFARVRLPVLEQWSCVARTGNLARLAPLEAQPVLDALLAEFIEYRQPTLDTLIAMFQAAADEHGQIAETRLRKRWGELLAYAECHLVTDAELEPTLTAIEQRIASKERARLLAQLPFDPFVTER
jgi:hypothetical protein